MGTCEAVAKGKRALGFVHEVLQKVCRLVQFEEGLSFEVELCNT
jgi:hypothetical protein